MAQKAAGIALSVIAGVSLWKEFGPRTYLVTVERSGRVDHRVVQTAAHPTFGFQMYNAFKDINRADMVITSIKRMY